MGEAIQHAVESLSLVLPAVWLLVAGSLMLCGSLVTELPKSAQTARSAVTYFAIATLAILGVALALSMNRSPLERVEKSLFLFDWSAQACERLTLFGSLLIVLIGWIRAPWRFLPEYYGCLLLATAGTLLVGCSADLVTLYLGLELVSVSTYILLSIVRSDTSGMEATLKYLILSVFSAGFFLLGASYLYGISGSTNLSAILAALEAPGRMPTLALALVFGGLAFRISSFPFHAYAPDVFDGTSLTMSAALSYLPKVTGFVAIIRLLGGWPLNASVGDNVITILLVLAMGSMCIGNLMALAQSSIRRIMAYSSVAHSGYILLALAAQASLGQSPTVVYSYLAAYAAMTLGVFACICALEGQPVPRAENSPESRRLTLRTLDDLSGQFARNRFVASMMIICLLSLIGLPLTGGFWAKLRVIIAAIQSERLDLRVGAIVMAFSAVIAAIYYWRMVSKLIEPAGDQQTSSTVPLTPVSRNAAPLLAVVLAAGFTIYWFFMPSQM